MSDITQIGSNISSIDASVSINGSGNIVAIGEYINNKTKIYEFNGTSWSQLGNDINREASGDYSGISVSLNIVGDRVAIGAFLNDGNGSDSGHTRIFQYDNDTDTWVQLGGDIDGEAASDYSGFSVSLNSVGDRVAIGAYLNDGGGSDSGHVRIYEYDNSSNAWNQLGGDIDGEASGDQSGYSVSLNSLGDIVAIGAPQNDGSGSDSGHTRIYQYDSSSNTWIQLGQDIDAEATGDKSGYSVSLNSAGDRVAIGAIFNNGSVPYNGHTRIYEYNSSSNTWAQLGQDIDGEAIGGYSGYSVSLNSLGNIVAIGAPYNDAGGDDKGHTRIYQYDNDTNTWLQFGIDIDGGSDLDEFGRSVSLNSQGNIVAIVAYSYTKVYQLDIDLNLDDLINSDISMVPPVDDLLNDVTYKRIITGNPNIAGFDAQLITVPSNNSSISMLRLDAFDLAGQKLNLTGLTGNERIWIEVEYPNYNPSKKYEFLKYDEVTLKKVSSPDYPVKLKPVLGKPNTLGGYLTGLSVIGLNEKSNTTKIIIKKKVVPKKKYIYLFNNTTGCKRRVLC